MNTETKQDLDDAIAAHFAERFDGALATGYVLHIEGRALDEKMTILTLSETADGQSPIVTLGLAAASTARAYGFAGLA